MWDKGESGWIFKGLLGVTEAVQMVFYSDSGKEMADKDKDREREKDVS